MPNCLRSRPAQFAGIRTDEDLNITGEPLMIYCKLAEDSLPSPEACLVTGITPQEANEKGLPEAEFIKLIHDEFAQANTCGVGYNSLRFDDRSQVVYIVDIERRCLLFLLIALHRIV